MLDLKFIRENPELVREAVANRQDTAPLDEIRQLDTERRQKILELENLRHARKETAREQKIDAEVIGDAVTRAKAKIKDLAKIRTDCGNIRKSNDEIESLARSLEREIEAALGEIIAALR